ncbi:MAG TPA: hypothetical protein VJT74_07060, partial [Pyrinomonadaceae bacterium]|nr:hypothetical protein [Pyrinomonadaceae bacterium]
KVPEGRVSKREAEDRHPRQRKGRGTPRVDKAITTAFTGLAFLIIAIILSETPMGRFWWFWLLIPAFTMIGGGLAEYIRYKHSRDKEQDLPDVESRPAVPPARVSALPPRNTSEMVPPPSVTEGTTRHLGIKAERPAKDS